MKRHDGLLLTMSNDSDDALFSQWPDLIPALHSPPPLRSGRALEPIGDPLADAWFK